MGKRLDLVGQKFGRLTCLEYVGKDFNKNCIFKFQCNCGNIIKIRGSNVNRGYTKSCGCLHKERTSETNKKDLTGQRFGKLTCLELIKADKHGASVFNFLCECGKIVEILGKSVISGHTKSCGCLHIEQTSLLGSTIGFNNSKSANKGWCYDSIRMRSGLEIMYAHYLDENKIDWEYEPETFKLENGLRYTPDFYLPETDKWVEIKGRITDKNKKKISLFRTQTRNKLNVYFQKDLERMMGESYYQFMKENKEYYL